MSRIESSFSKAHQIRMITFEIHKDNKLINLDMRIWLAGIVVGPYTHIKGAN